ncbi:plasminogen-like [Branchiostoma floridae x Branchiostoma belcheri]
MYRGTVSVTNTGKTCQRWDSQTPHEHIKTPAAYPSAGLEQNYCRNPDGEPGVWCFTTDPNSRWELCDVPSCISCQYEDGASYRGTVSVTNTGKTCQRWDSQTPHEHIKTPAAYPSAGLERNYCRNPDGELGVWCFTTDPNSRWELCDVPSCVSCQYADGASYRGPTQARPVNAGTVRHPMNTSRHLLPTHRLGLSGTTAGTRTANSESGALPRILTRDGSCVTYRHVGCECSLANLTYR